MSIITDIPDCPDRKDQFENLLERALMYVARKIKDDIITCKKCDTKLYLSENNFDSSLCLDLISTIEGKGYRCEYEETGGCSPGHYFYITVPKISADMIKDGKYMHTHRGRSSIIYSQNLKEAKRRAHNDAQIKVISKPVPRPKGKKPSKIKALLIKLYTYYFPGDVSPTHSVSVPDIPKEIYDEIDEEIKRKALDVSKNDATV